MPEGKQWGAPLQALLATAETLNTASTRLNTILQDVEQTLVAAHIGLEVWLTDARQALERSTGARLSSDGVTGSTWVELGFARLPDGWHLAVRHIDVEEGPPDDDGDPRWTHRVCVREPYPIAQASRKARIAALQLLPALIGALRQEARKAIKAIDKAKNLSMC